MTELQQIFLYYVFIYFLIKGGLYVGLYVVTVMIEKHARERHAKLRIYLQKKRAQEQDRWEVAYNLYARKYQKKLLVKSA